MNFRAFEEAFRAFPVFSLRDIEKHFPDFDRRRLVEWQHKGYLKRIRQGYYYFAGVNKQESFLFYAANCIYAPSYLSLESAMSWYGFIPEGVFSLTSVSTRNTARFDTQLGLFVYHHFKPKMFFGYTLLPFGGQSIRMAEPEKLLLDYFYFWKIDSRQEMDALRLNTFQLRESLDMHKLDDYLRFTQSGVLRKRIKIFKELLYA
jgi:predicted transcriptional regulator of viral defense system